MNSLLKSLDHSYKQPTRRLKAIPWCCCHNKGKIMCIAKIWQHFIEKLLGKKKQLRAHTVLLLISVTVRRARPSDLWRYKDIWWIRQKTVFPRSVVPTVSGAAIWLILAAANFSSRQSVHLFTASVMETSHLTKSGVQRSFPSFIPFFLTLASA